MKKQFFSSLLILSCAFLQSCYDIDDNRRVLVIGSTGDRFGFPIEGIAVEARGNSSVLGSAISNENGNFEFTSLESTTEDFSIYINPEITGDTLYASPVYINLDETSMPIGNRKNRRSQNLYDLGMVKLPKLAFFEIIINRSTLQDTLTYTLEFPGIVCQNYFIEDKLDTMRSECFSLTQRSGTLLPGDQNLELGYRSLKDSAVVFSYHINSAPTQQATILLDKYSTRYVIDL